jgi:hypothetical protein
MTAPKLRVDLIISIKCGKPGTRRPPGDRESSIRRKVVKGWGSADELRRHATDICRSPAGGVQALNGLPNEGCKTNQERPDHKQLRSVGNRREQRGRDHWSGRRLRMRNRGFERESESDRHNKSGDQRGEEEDPIPFPHCGEGHFKRCATR